MRYPSNAGGKSGNSSSTSTTSGKRTPSCTPFAATPAATHANAPLIARRRVKPCSIPSTVGMVGRTRRARRAMYLDTRHISLMTAHNTPNPARTNTKSCPADITWITRDGSSGRKICPPNTPNHANLSEHARSTTPSEMRAARPKRNGRTTVRNAIPAQTGPSDKKNITKNRMSAHRRFHHELHGAEQPARQQRIGCRPEAARGEGVASGGTGLPRQQPFGPFLPRQRRVT